MVPPLGKWLYPKSERVVGPCHTRPSKHCFRGKQGCLAAVLLCLPCDIVRNNVFRNMFRACFVFSACTILSKNVLTLSQWTTPYTSCDICLDIYSTEMAKKTCVLSHINLEINTGTLIDLYQDHSALWDARSLEYRNRDIKSTSSASVRVNFSHGFERDRMHRRVAFAAVRHFAAVMPRGGYSRQTLRLFRKTLVSCATSLFSKTRVCSNVS